MLYLCILKSYIVHYSSSFNSDSMNTFIPSLSVCSLSLDRKQGCGIFIYRVAWRPGGVIEWEGGGAEHTGPALITQRASFWQPFSSGCPPARCTRSQREKEEKRIATAIVRTLILEKILKGTQAWNFFFDFFCRNRNHMVKGPVTRDFWKSYSIRPRYSTFKHFRACSACDEIGSAYSQHAMKFVPRMLSVR